MSDYTSLIAQARSTRRRLDQLQGQARQLALEGKRTKEEIASLKADMAIYEEAAAVLASIGETKQERAQEQIETLVTQGLRTIFDEDLSFHVVSSRRGKVPVTEFMIRSVYENRVIETPVIKARGAGYAAIVGVLLRIVIMLLSLDKQESVLFLDEPFAKVSAEHGPKLAEFLRYLVDKTSVQIIVICHTHKDELMEIADKRYEFTRPNGGWTKVIEL